ncbi:hypothetical protein AMATHDRAFT_76769 [Amanita thiersii Skay4041]|uniref:PARP catalytic domain-containing protein n=1 Tax=Amanita thiersii Skay4041 TaxID=703135 RepID=A0A2A9NJF9_9AGAR|nr:hypothetical protein AMATHDRAFT_76769 [Amanita thiersii Skay4041]
MSSLVKSVVHSWHSHHKQQSIDPSDLCEICQKKPKYVEKGFKHPYCGKTCARAGGNSSSNPCGLSGCRFPARTAFVNFCSDSHAREAVRLGQAPGCESCKMYPRIVGTVCASCDRRARAVAPRLRELNKDGSTFKSIRAAFRSEWAVFSTIPNVEKVYEVVLPYEIRDSYELYRDANPHKTLIRTFHGAQCICDMGTKEAALCSFRSCGICCAVKSCFKSFAFGAKYNVGRFGPGIYSYRDPGLADRFATSCTTSPYRVMIACDTAVDQSQCSRSDEANDKEPIFTTVIDAIMPVYIIMYTR